MDPSFRQCELGCEQHTTTVAFNAICRHATFRANSHSITVATQIFPTDDIEVRDGDEQTPQPEVVLRLNGEILEEQAAEIEKSPQAKLNKTVQQVKTALKKERSNKQQKSKENDSANGVSLSKKILTGGIFNNEADGIQLKVVKQNNQDFANEVSLKSKPNKLPCLGIDQKNVSCFISPDVPPTPKLGVESPSEKQEASSPTINLLSQSTFL